MERTFDFDGATLTVRSATVRSRITRDVLTATLAGLNPGQRVEAVMFANLVSQTTLDAGDLNGFELPLLSDTEAAIQEKFLGILALPAELYDAWMVAWNSVDAPNPEALYDEKKAPSSTA